MPPGVSMPVVLTGDVHQAIGSSDQQFTDCSEAALAVEYAQIAASFGLKVTLFFTGRAIVEVENEGAAKPLLAMDNVEIGGHGWDALRPRWWHRMMSGLTGSPHGPQWLQRRMIQRTCATIRRYADKPVRSWRNHAYRHDQNTPYLLAESGISVWSDHVQPERHNPYPHPSGLVVLPLNTLPDHENLYHGKRTPARLIAREMPLSYSPDDWLDMVRTQIESIVSGGGTATILAHPICMKVVDNWDTFEQLCSLLSNYINVFAREARAETS